EAQTHDRHHSTGPFIAAPPVPVAVTQRDDNGEETAEKRIFFRSVPVWRGDDRAVARGRAGAAVPSGRADRGRQPRPPDRTAYSGEDSALDAIRDYAATIGAIVRRIEDALDKGPATSNADDAIALPRKTA